jgi:hypothetical protein
MNSTKLHWLFRGGGGQFALIRGVCFTKILGAVVLTLLVLLPASWQPGMTATTDPGTEKVVDAGGNLRVPGDYRTAYQFFASSLSGVGGGHASGASPAVGGRYFYHAWAPR